MEVEKLLEKFSYPLYRETTPLVARLFVWLLGVFFTPKSTSLMKWWKHFCKNV